MHCCGIAAAIFFSPFSGNGNRCEPYKCGGIVNDKPGGNRVQTRWFARLSMLALVSLGAASFAASAHAQTDEIQVYDGGLAAPGKFNLTIHSNFIASGSNTPAFPGALIPDKSFN